MKTNRALLQNLTAISAVLLLTSTIHSETVGFWRMEQDDDTGGGYSITNEAGYAPLTGSSGGVDTGKPDSVMTNLLENSLSNTGSLAGETDTGVNIDGTVASYTNLNSESITVEFFARTDEGMAGFMTRSTGSNGQTFGSDGISIYGPNSINVRFYTTTNGVTVTNHWSGIYNTYYDWDHHAFTYDAASGTATYYINSIIIASEDGLDNAPLYWGPSNTVIKVGNSMDGNALKNQDKGLIDELRVSNTALSQDELLYRQHMFARDSFAVNSNPGSYYTGNVKHNNTGTQDGVAGTIGFSMGKKWTGASTGNMQINTAVNMTHSLLADEMSGALLCKAKDTRNQYRQLSTTVPDVPVYYMCALQRAWTNEPNERISLGFSNTAGNRNKGIHVGFNDGKMAVFAGGNAYDITGKNYEYNKNYLVVLRLTANKTGDDLIDVYLSEPDDEYINFQQQITVETFSSTADLGYLKTYILGHGNDDYANVAWQFDEIRLATDAAALGIDPSLLVIPPPVGTLLILQ